MNRRDEDHEARLSALLDGGLSLEEIDAVRAHLAGCDDCRRDLAETLCDEKEALAALSPDFPEPLWETIRARTVDASSPLAVVTVDAEILTLDEAAAYLRLNLGELTVSLAEIPHFKIAGHVRFRRSSLESWIERREIAESDASRVVDFIEARARLSRFGRI